ncbi:hypothetical protein D3C87_1369230 [compost metagenome]
MINIAEVMMLIWYATRVKKAPIFNLEASSGKEPIDSEIERLIGYITPPPRAVFDGITGDRTNSANDNP